MAAGVTLTGTLTDTGGNPIAGIVTLTLCNFGPIPPVIVGTGNFVLLQISATANGSGAFSITFYGNYQISPAGTYYQITIQQPGYSQIAMDSVIGANYQFMTPGTFNLSNLTPFGPGYPAPVPANETYSYEEVPAGTINGSNATFTLLYTPNPPQSLNLFQNGTRMTRGTAYTLAGNTITYAAGYIPHTGASHICSYTHK